MPYIYNFLWKLIEFPYTKKNDENYNSFTRSHNYVVYALVEISEWISIRISDYKLDLHVHGGK